MRDGPLRPLGPRRLAGTNPRSVGTDRRSQLAAPRQLGWPVNERFLMAATAAVSAPLEEGPPSIWRGPHGPTNGLTAAPGGVLGPVADSDYRRRASAVSGPCLLCGDDGWHLTPSGAVICAERVPPLDSDPEPFEWFDTPRPAIDAGAP